MPRYLVLCAIFLFHSVLSAEEITVAVAANFKGPMEEIKIEFQKAFKDTVVPVYGASGQLTSQIKNGAPFDLFLSADMKYPQDLFKTDFAVSSPKPYAIGILILLGTKENKNNSDWKELLLSPEIKHIAVANPASAPYGEAAVQALKHYGIYDALLPKIVFGESITQVNQFIFSESSDFGFTSKSALHSESFQKKQISFQIDPKSYAPIMQGVVMLKSVQGPKKNAIQNFYGFLFTKEVQSILLKYGYELPK